MNLSVRIGAFIKILKDYYALMENLNVRKSTKRKRYE